MIILYFLKVLGIIDCNKIVYLIENLPFLNIGDSPKPHILFFIRMGYVSKGYHKRSA
jgi:hypothetical protein